MAKPSKKLEAFNFLYSGIIIFTFLLLAATSFLNLGREGYNREALIVYLLGSVVGLAAALVFAVFGVFNLIKRKTSNGEEFPFQAGFVSESSKLAFLSNSFITKLAPHAAWVILVLFLSLSGFQIWQSPDVYSTTQEFATASGEPYAAQDFGTLRSVWEVGVLPGFTEDMASLVISAFFVMFGAIWLLVLGKTTGSDLFRYNVGWHIALVLIACPIASIGLNFIPGFAQAHESVAGQNIAFLLAAFLFQTINLYVMWFTGLFFPLAHIVHNAVFVLGFSVALSIAFIAVVLPRGKGNLNDRLASLTRYLPFIDIKTQVRCIRWLLQKVRIRGCWAFPSSRLP